MPKFIVRFDDVTNSMDWDNFLSVKKVLEEYSILSVLGVVPENQDSQLNVSIGKSLTNSDFFSIIKKYKEYGDTIAQHGTYHLYDTKNSGILKINNNSEFAGHSYDEQLNKLNVGKNILQNFNVWQPYFMAPSHSFDLNTLKALRDLNFKAITDGYGFYPYEMEGIVLVPQLLSKPMPFLSCGIQTICLHTNTMSKLAIKNFIVFVHENNKFFVDFKEVANSKINSNVKTKVGYMLSAFFIKIIRSVKRL